MAPIVDEAHNLVKRIIYTNGYNNDGYYRRSHRPWWIVFIVVFPLLFILLLVIARRRNFRRRNQGLQPLPYTGWTTYQFNQQGNQQYPQQQQPYGNQNNGYYNKEGANDQQIPPTYQEANTNFQRPDGPPPSADYYGETANQYQRPEGAPPSNTEYPSYPAQSHTK